MKVKLPTEQDFAEFGTITEKYRDQIKKMF